MAPTPSRPAVRLLVGLLAVVLCGLCLILNAGSAAAAQARGAHLGLSQKRSLGGKSCKAMRSRARSASTARRRLRIQRRLQRCDQQRAETSAAAVDLYWGASIGDQITGDQAPWDMGALSQFESMVGKSLSLVHFMAPFSQCGSQGCSYYKFPAREMQSIRDHGSIPFFSWSSQSIPSQLNEPDYQLSDVIAGTYDSFIREWATSAKNWGHPFFLRFNWEMNGNWFPWSEGVNGNGPGEYVAAWRHVHDIFTAVGATNVTWVWCPNVDPTGKMQDLGSLYPGDSYVDWTSLDGYNWGTNPVRPGGWKTFDDLYSSTYHEITEMLADLPVSYPKIRGLVWFEKYDDDMDWPIETSSTATSAFAAGIQSASYRGNEFGNLGSAPIPPPS
jgi:Glycosyl hydrolase family 26